MGGHPNSTAPVGPAGLAVILQGRKGAGTGGRHLPGGATNWLPLARDAEVLPGPGGPGATWTLEGPGLTPTCSK